MRFRKIYIEISNICNLDCEFCHGTNRKPETMSPADFEIIARQAAPLAEQVHLHVTGEPLLHPGFRRIIEICAEHKLPVEITTNGSLMRSANAESLFEPIVRQVNISMHSLSEKDTVQLREIFDFTQEASTRHPDLYINYRLWNLGVSKESLESGKNEWIRKKIEEEFGIVIPAAGHSSGRKSRKLLNRLYLHLDTCFEWPEIRADKPTRMKGRCHAMTSQIAILVDGTVVPCCLDKEGVMALGNCRSEPLESIIASAQAEKMLKGFEKGLLTEKLCQHCTYSSRFKKLPSKESTVITRDHTRSQVAI